MCITDTASLFICEKCKQRANTNVDGLCNKCRKENPDRTGGRKIIVFTDTKAEATGYGKHEAILKPAPQKPRHTPDPIPQDYPDITPELPNL